MSPQDKDETGSGFAGIISSSFDLMVRKAGATDNGPPGERPQYTKGYYAAYVLDPDGHNIECVYFRPWWLMALQQAPTLLGVGAVGLAWWAGRNGWMIP